MKTTKFSSWKSAALTALLVYGGAADADLKLKAVVSGSGAGVADAPVAGEYEIDFQEDRARIVRPDGMIGIVNFQSSQMAVLDTSSHTYYIKSLTDILGGKSMERQPASKVQKFQMSSSGQTQTVVGLTAEQYEVALTEVPASSAASVDSLQAMMTVSQDERLPAKARMSLARWASAQNNDSASLAVKGEVLVVKSSQISQKIPSAAPLALVGVPRAICTSITNALDADQFVPVGFTFTWPEASSANQLETLSMSLVSIDSTNLDSSVTQIPSGYTQVAAPH